MSRIEQILFPIDFSERCVAAATHVSTWPNRFSAEVIALHVVDPGDYFASPHLEDPRIQEELVGLTAQRSRDLDYFCNRYLPDNRVRKMVSNGSAAELIVAIAKADNADLVMLPRHHQGLGSRWLHDSLVARVLNVCVIPVWTSEKVESLPAVPFEQIVCAVHVDRDLLLDAANRRLLDVVRFVANGFNAAVTCLYVAKSQLDREIPAISERLADIRHEMQGVSEFETETGSIKQAIVDVANRRRADLIVLGRNRLGTVGLGVQGHILQVDHEARCPVLSVL